MDAKVPELVEGGRRVASAREELAWRVAGRYVEGLSLREVAREFGFSDTKVASLLKLVGVPRRKAGGDTVSSGTRARAYPLSSWDPLEDVADLEDRLAFNLRALSRLGLDDRPGGIGHPPEFWAIIADTYEALARAGVANPVQRLMAETNALGGVQVSRHRVAGWIKICRNKKLITSGAKSSRAAADA